MPRTTGVTISVTKLYAFRRLAEFVEDVKEHAENVQDDRLMDIIQGLAEDLLEELE